MKHFWPITGWVFVIVAMLFVASILMGVGVQAEDRGAWFKSLKMPGTDASCCDISDCKPTQAKYNGGWWAVVRGTLRHIPPERVLKKPYSVDGEAYVCSSQAGAPEDAIIYCFVPPTLGY